MTILGDLIRALADADWDRADSLVEELDRANWEGGLQVVGAAFALAVNRHFGPDTTPADVARFVSSARASYHDGGTLPALEMEGLIRAALGDPALADNIAPDIALGVEVFILGLLLQNARLTPEQLDEFVAEAERTAAEYR
ncbi:hypothetical protein [Salinispora arenicola]|uniref:hypothetical protein n=1 Tax=Salinispora arenicola TaxID=168697 RepID=UPI002079B932|nr:hypothetical protein [Salinispora arenicola]MCN0153285.1 hypothetical protein [Salinispora arenicola]